MKTTRTLMAATVLLISGTAFAQTTPPPPNGGEALATGVQHDVNQQNRIEQGLQSGQLSTQEASQLERHEAHIDNLEQKDMKNGKLSPQEQAQLNAAQNRVSQDIYADRHNSTVGQANSPSSQRMQADVQRDANQQQRIENGLQGGRLTNNEVGNLERGQSHVNSAEAAGGANGRVGAAEQSKIQGKENNQNQRETQANHNDNVRKHPLH